MTTLIPKFDVKNGGTTSLGAINRPINQKLSDVISVKDFGAVGDGTTDDYAAIQNAITYAQSGYNRTVYFPDGNYSVSASVTFTSQTGIDCSSNATITATSNTFPVLTLAPANYGNTILNIPSLYGGSIGLYLYGTALAQINIGNIANCVDGLVLAIDNTNKVCADNVITFTVINSCSSAGIKFSYGATTKSGTLMQGNQIKGNFVVSCKYGTEFYDINNGTLNNLPWDDTEIDVFAVDSANMTGSIGIYANPTLPPARTTFKHRGFFGGFDTAYLKGSGIGTIFELSFPQAPEYAKMQQSAAAGSRIIECSGGQGQLWGVNPIPAMTTTDNSISTFNGGNPLQANRNFLSFTIASPMVAGDTASFYWYHPLMCQYSPKVTTELFVDNTAPITVLWCGEKSTPGAPTPGGSNTYPFQGLMIIRALGNVPAGTYYVAITLHDAPQ
jgi:hypothetical protein